MAGSAWTNQLVALLIISAAAGGFSGVFEYSPAPGAGTLIASSAAAAGTDPYGNHYLQGQASYAGSFAASLNAGFVNFYTGSLSAGWTVQAGIEIDSGGDLLLFANGNIFANGNLIG